MTFASTITGQTYWGSKKVSFGTFTNDSGDTGGDIDTGLAQCDFIHLQHKGSGAIATIPVVDEDFPCAGNAITIITADNGDGTWWAFGF